LEILMNNFRLPGRTGARALAVAAIVTLAACQDENTGLLVDPGTSASASLQGSFVASALDARAGEQVTIALEPASLAGVTFAGLEGELRYDARLLEFKGQVADNNTMVVVNASEPGRIRMQALNVRGLAARPAIFAFEVKGAGWENALDFRSDHYVAVDGTDYALGFVRGAVRGADIGVASSARMMTTEDWAAYLGATQPARVVSFGGMENSPTGSTKWGDSNGDNVVNVLDNLFTANVSVGNIAQAECLLAAGALTGDCNAVNVDPANTPGLGGPLDVCPPGWNSCTLGGRTINVLDNLAIALESTSPGSQTVAGRDMVFGSGLSGPLTVTDTTDLCVGAVAGTRRYLGTLNLVNTTLYRLNGCRVAIGDEAATADSGTVNIEAGTIIEGTDSSSFEVSRNGRIFALGTFVQPITFTCVNDAPPRAPGCWGGVQVVGNAVVNESTAGSNPATYARAGGGGNQKALEGFVPANLFYGGNNDADNSGTLRHVIVAYGGRAVAANNELNNLTIGACGSGTTLEWIQTHAGTDDGLEIFGGRCNVKGLYSSLNDDDQFDLSFGYDGSSQFVFIRSGVDNGTGTNTDVGLEWDNSENSATYNNTPRTIPVVWNMTAVSGSATLASVDKFANIRRGAGANINNAVVINYLQGFDIDETASCSLIGSTLTFHGVFLSVASDVINGTNCLATQMQGHLTAQAGLNAYAAAAYAGQMKDPYSITNPDIRSTTGASLGTSVTPRTPPSGGFFDTGAAYLGAAPPTSLANGGIPFYAGWAIHAQNSTTR
jgi:hypothetical protein